LAIPSLDELISFAEKVAAKTKAYGAEEAESYVLWGQSLDAEIQGGLVSIREGETAGIGVRAVIGKRVGFAAASSIDERKAFDTAEKAVKVAQIRPEDPKFVQLPDPVKRESRSGQFDEKILDVTGTDIVKAVKNIVEEAKEVDSRITYVGGSIGLVVNQFAVANTRGINVGDRGTGIAGGIYCKAKQNAEDRTGTESIFSRKLVDFTGIGTTAARRAIESLGAKKLDAPKTLPVIFDSYTSTMFLSLLSYAVSARSVQESRSALGGKMGEKVAWKNFTVKDDSWMQDGMRTAKYDAEGIPTTVKPVIEKGVLKNYLYDSYTAHNEGKTSTGNAARGSGESYLQTPGISPVNWYVEPGKKPLEDLVTEVDEAILVRFSLMGVGHSNYISGDFSVVATNPFYIRKGTIVYPLHPITVAGNVYEALTNIIEIGSDLRLSLTGKSPSILISSLSCTP